MSAVHSSTGEIGMSIIQLHCCDRCRELFKPVHSNDYMQVRVDLEGSRDWHPRMEVCSNCAKVIYITLQELLNAPSIYTTEARVEVSTEKNRYNQQVTRVIIGDTNE